MTTDIVSPDLAIHALVGPVIQQLPATVRAGVLRSASDLQEVNTRLWDTEDAAREAQDSEALAAAKRRIDRLNLERNGLIEHIDDALTTALPGDGAIARSLDTPLHTETIGSVIDRLVILALRICRTRAASHGNMDLASRIAQLEVQMDQLTNGLMTLVAEVQSGARRLPDGRRFKLYGSQASAPQHT